jgi:hypothetical protein
VIIPAWSGDSRRRRKEHLGKETLGRHQRELYSCDLKCFCKGSCVECLILSSQHCWEVVEPSGGVPYGRKWGLWGSALEGNSGTPMSPQLPDFHEMSTFALPHAPHHDILLHHRHKWYGKQTKACNLFPPFKLSISGILSQWWELTNTTAVFKGLIPVGQHSYLHGRLVAPSMRLAFSLSPHSFSVENLHLVCLVQWHMSLAVFPSDWEWENYSSLLNDGQSYQSLQIPVACGIFTIIDYLANSQRMKIISAQAKFSLFSMWHFLQELFENSGLRT